MAVNITNENFENEIVNSEKPVLVDFWASWCGPCKMLSPIVDEVSEETDKVKVCKINIDDYPELAKKYRVMSIPTLIVMENGKEIKRSVGVIPKDDILNLF